MLILVCSFDGVNRDFLAIAAVAFEFDDAVGECKERVVAPETDVLARMPPGAALADQDVARTDELPTEPFDAQTFGIRVAAVLCRAAAFFMCHRLLTQCDTSDFDFGVLLAMPAQLLVAFPALFLEHEHFFPLAVCANGCSDRCGDVWGAKLDAVAIEHCKDAPEFDRLPWLGSKMRNDMPLVRLDAVLLTSDFDDCLHEEFPSVVGCKNTRCRTIEGLGSLSLAQPRMRGWACGYQPAASPSPIVIRMRRDWPLSSSAARRQ